MNKFEIILAMLVLAIFAVGSVSAADNATTDIDVPADDIEIDDISVEENVENKVISEEVNIQSDSYDELIVNPSFDNGTYDGWVWVPASTPSTAASSIVIESDDEHINYVNITGAGNQAPPYGIAYIYQIINFDKILNITFEYKSSDTGYVGYYIGEMDYNTGYNHIGGDNDVWQTYTIDTSDIYGELKFCLISGHAKQTIIKGYPPFVPDTIYGGGSSCFDSITYCLEESADFDVNDYLNNPIIFSYNTTDNITSWLWDFGDGTYSNLSSPVHSYSSINKYNALLTIVNNESETKNITYSVNIIEELIPDFEFVPFITFSGKQDYFTDLTSGNPVKWSWNLGNGVIRNYTDAKDTFQYNYDDAISNFDVTLTVTDKFGRESSKTKTITLYNNVSNAANSIDFTGGAPDDWAPVSNSNYYGYEKIIDFDEYDYVYVSVAGKNDQTYTFIYIDDNEVARVVISRGYSVTYSNSSLYGVHKLSILSWYDIKKVVLGNYANVADFDIESISIENGNFSVSFKDNSAGVISDYVWEFDDGETFTSNVLSAVLNPTHIFNTTGDHWTTLHIYKDGLELDKYTYHFTLTKPSVNGVGYDSIQDAVNNASEGDVVVITPLEGSVYSENIFVNKSLTLNFNGAVIKPADDATSLFTISDGADVTINNVSFGTANTIITDDSSSLTIKDSSIDVNLALDEGNIVLDNVEFDNSYLTITANTVIANSTISRGGVIVNDGKSKIFNTTLTGSDVAVSQNDGELDIISNLITDNRIGVNVTGGKTNLEYNIIYNNTAFGLLYAGDNVSNANNWWGAVMPVYSSGENLPEEYYDIFRLDDDGEVDITSWLELNVNASSSVMGVNKEYPVTVYLTENSDGETISGYLKTVTLDFVSDGGDIFDSVILENGTGQMTLLTANNDVNDVNVTYNGKDYALNSDIVANTSVSIDVSGDLFVGGNAVVNIEVPYATGNITLIVDGVSSSVELDDSQYVLTLNNLTAGVHFIEANYGGSDIFDPTGNNVLFNVSKLTPEIIISEIKVNVNEDAIVEVNIEGATGFVLVEVDGNKYFTELEDGNATVIVTGLKAGNYTANIRYFGDDKYNTSSDTCVIEVNKATPEITVSADSISYGDVLIVNINSDVDGEYTVTVNDLSVIVNVVDGQGSAKFTDLAAGSYNVVASFAGDDNYNNASADVNVKVNRATPGIILIADDIVYGDVLVVNVVLPDDVTRRAIVSVDNESKFVSLKNGIGSVKFTDLAAGSHSVVASYNGDGNYIKYSVESSVKVNRTAPGLIVKTDSIRSGEDLIVTITAQEDIARRVSVSVGNETKLVSLVNGSASVKFTGLTVGSYKVVASYNGDENYAKESVTANVKVSRVAGDITVVANPSTYGEDTIIVVQLPDDVTRRAIVTIGNETQLVSLTNGVGVAKFSGLTVGTHDVSVSYNGDNNYIQSSVNTTVKVNKAVPEIKVTANNIVAGETAVVDVELPADISKRPLVEIDGVEKYVTVKSGTGSVKFTGLTAGTYDVNVSYVGDSTYKASSKSIKLTVE